MAEFGESIGAFCIFYSSKVLSVPSMLKQSNSIIPLLLFSPQTLLSALVASNFCRRKLKTQSHFVGVIPVPHILSSQDVISVLLQPPLHYAAIYRCRLTSESLELYPMSLLDSLEPPRFLGNRTNANPTQIPNLGHSARTWGRVTTPSFV